MTAFAYPSPLQTERCAEKGLSRHVRGDRGNACPCKQVEGVLRVPVAPPLDVRHPELW